MLMPYKLFEKGNIGVTVSIGWPMVCQLLVCLHINGLMKKYCNLTLFYITSYKSFALSFRYDVFNLKSEETTSTFLT